MSDSYTEEDVETGRTAWINAEWENDERADVRVILDAVAPAIAARAEVKALRALVRECFDEQDAGVTVGGIETVEVYIFDTIAKLTGDPADHANAERMREIAAESYARKTGRTP